MTIYQRGKPLRDWLVSTDDAAKALHVPERTIRSLSAEGLECDQQELSPLAHATTFSAVLSRASPLVE